MPHLRTGFLSKDLLTKFDLLPVRRIVQRNRLRWFSHAVRMDNDNWVKKCMTLKVYGRRDPGRPKKTWEQVIASDLYELGAGQTKLEEEYCDEQSNPCQHGIINDFKLMMMMIDDDDMNQGGKPYAQIPI